MTLPAVVVSGADLGKRHGLAWVLMITSAANRAWPGDVPIRNLQRAGLPAASIVRTAKIATMAAVEASKLGVIGRNELARVMSMIARMLEEHRP
ncbi:MAG: type II toxin-antitoxin system PemK/MazF family toxin [Pseudomonadales bacterium]|nr:type II toxin-antitoxin system PemK/MazF family toxin [Pseudomonadales bacterium]